MSIPQKIRVLIDYFIIATIVLGCILPFSRDLWYSVDYLIVILLLIRRTFFND